MRGKIRKCTVCGRYTLKTEKCPECGGVVRSPHPARFSPDDKWGKYRRKLIKSIRDC